MPSNHSPDGSVRWPLIRLARRTTMSLQALLGTQLPLIQAPMAGVQLHGLAAAVSNAGALGSLPCAMLDAAGLRKELQALGEKTSKPYNLNFFCHTPPAIDSAREATWREALSPFYTELGINPATIASGPGRLPFSAEMADLLDEFRPAVVSFHFGLPSAELLVRVKACGAKVLSSATTVEEALWLQANGADAIIAQGLEAGGHRGMFLTDELNSQLGTFALLPQIVQAVQLPVIAAGGIVNRVMRELGPLSSLAPAFPLATAAIAPLRSKAESQGSGDFSQLWAGQNVSGCKGIGAAELTRELAQGFAP